MLSNPAWKQDVARTICRMTGLGEEWFSGKRVVDAGCGQGRWTYGFGRLRVAKCLSFDVSRNGLASTRAIAAEFGHGFEVIEHDILEPLATDARFDLVWCFGVLHHTGDTFRGFESIAGLVAPGGYLFLMLYGEPRPERVGDYDYYHEIEEVRRQTRHLPFATKVDLLRQRYPGDQFHGYFDAISPEINDLYRFDEIAGWLVDAGFEQIRRTEPESANHHVIARRRA